MNKTLLAAAGAALALSPGAALACACGCGIFDVGSGSMMPAGSQTGLTLWFRYDEMDQNQNWEGNSQAPAADNGDKRIQTNFYTVGAIYSINHNWTLMAELPTYQRALTTTDDGTVAGPAGSIYTAHLTALGDMQVSGMYTGLSANMSTGVGLGMVLPTGDYTGPNGPLGGPEFDRDSLPGTGATSVVANGYHFGNLTADGKASYFVEARYQVAIATRNDYRPGNEFDGALGAALNFNPASGPVSRVSPVVQLLESYRAHDSGANADPPNSGYERLLVGPGIDLHIKKFDIYADAELPIYQYANSAQGAVKISDGSSGQLVASVLYKIRIAYSF